MGAGAVRQPGARTPILNGRHSMARRSPAPMAPVPQAAAGPVRRREHIGCRHEQGLSFTICSPGGGERPRGAGPAKGGFGCGTASTTSRHLANLARWGVRCLAPRGSAGGICERRRDHVGAGLRCGRPFLAIVAVISKPRPPALRSSDARAFWSVS